MNNNINLINKRIETAKDFENLSMYGYMFLLNKFDVIIEYSMNKGNTKQTMSILIQHIRELVFNIQILDILSPPYSFLVKHYFDKYYSKKVPRNFVEQIIFNAFSLMIQSLGVNEQQNIESIKLILDSNNQYQDEQFEIDENVQWLTIELSKQISLSSEDKKNYETLLNFYTTLMKEFAKKLFNSPKEQPLFFEISYNPTMQLEGNIKDNLIKALSVEKQNYDETKNNNKRNLGSILERITSPKDDLVNLDEPLVQNNNQPFLQNNQPFVQNNNQPFVQNNQNNQPFVQNNNQPFVQNNNQPFVQNNQNNQPSVQNNNRPSINNNNQPLIPEIKPINHEYFDDKKGGVVSLVKNLSYNYVTNISFYFAESLLKSRESMDTEKEDIEETGQPIKEGKKLDVVYRNVIPLIQGKYVKSINSSCTISCMNSGIRDGIHTIYFVYMRTQGLDNTKLEENAEKYIINTTNTSFAPSEERTDGIYGSMHFVLPIYSTSYNLTNKMTNKSRFDLLNTETLSVVIICVRNNIGSNINLSTNNVTSENSSNNLIMFDFKNFIKTNK